MKRYIFNALFVLLILVGCSSGGSNNAMTQTVSGNNANNTDALPATSINLDNSTKGALTDEQKYALAYMWHEEKLAKELYQELYKINPVQQLDKIATNSETTHVKLVQNLVEFYDINITNLANYEIRYSQEELENMPVGIFAIPEIQDLYNLLYERGKGSMQASLEVGCMVEVVDVNDLTKYLTIAQDNQAMTDTFTVLRNGSYNHYWAFDKGLKNLGISEGCCSLGSEYCHPEYPQNTH